MGRNKPKKGTGAYFSKKGGSVNAAFKNMGSFKSKNKKKDLYKRGRGKNF